MANKNAIKDRIGDSRDLEQILGALLTDSVVGLVLYYLDVERAVAREFYTVFGEHVNICEVIDDGCYSIHSNWFNFVRMEAEYTDNIPVNIFPVINWDLMIYRYKSDFVRIGSMFFRYTPDDLYKAEYEALGWEKCFGHIYRDEDGNRVFNEEAANTIDLVVSDYTNTTTIVSVCVNLATNMDGQGRYIMWGCEGMDDEVRHVRIIDSIPTHTITHS